MRHFRDAYRCGILVIAMAGTSLLGGGDAWAIDNWTSYDNYGARVTERIRRANMVEVFAVLQGWVHNDTQGSDLGLAMEFDETALAGLGVGYHLTDHLSVHFDALVGSTSVLLPQIQFKQGATVYSFMGHVDYNLLRTRLTPVATAGVGVIHLDSDLDFFPNFDTNQTNLTYSFGAGLRWDVTDALFVKAMYESVWTEIKVGDDDHRIDTINLYVGLTF